jgi:predicted dehydrogenase
MPLRIGLWGVGSHARKNLVPALAACNDTELVGALSRSDTDLPGVEVTSDGDRFLAMELDVVLIAGPNGLHAEHALRALEAGHHVWVEKPATTSLEDAELLVRRAADLGCVVLETDMFLHHPQWALLRSLADRIGGIDSVTARFGFPHLPPDNVRYRADLGGGALNDAGFYPVAAAVDLLGEDLRVAAARLTHRGFEVDTAGGALLVEDDGKRAHLEWGFGRGYRSEVEVWGPDGWLRAERTFAKPADLVAEVTMRMSDGSTFVEDSGPADHFVRMYAAFAEATRSGSVDTGALLRRARVMEEIRRA